MKWIRLPRCGGVVPTGHDRPPRARVIRRAFGAIQARGNCGRGVRVRYHKLPLEQSRLLVGCGGSWGPDVGPEMMVVASRGKEKRAGKTPQSFVKAQR